jgi:hypothetical protein
MVVLVEFADLVGKHQMLNALVRRHSPGLEMRKVRCSNTAAEGPTSPECSGAMLALVTGQDKVPEIY